MKESLLRYLICPICNADFELVNPVPEGEEITSALLACANGHSFPVTSGVPRLLAQDRLTEA